MIVGKSKKEVEFALGDPVKIKGLPGTVAEVVGTKGGRLLIQYQTERGKMEAQVKPFILEHASKTQPGSLKAGSEINNWEDLELLPIGSVVTQPINGQVFVRRHNAKPGAGFEVRSYWYAPGYTDGQLSNWLKFPLVVLRNGQN